MANLIDNTARSAASDARAARHPEKQKRADTPVLRKPDWIRVKAPLGKTFSETQEIVKKGGLVTVCEEAGCPNIGECWGHGTATFMLLGDICTRGCNFCSVSSGRPEELDEDEPAKVAEVIEDLGLDYAVLTSVNRDDLPDQGSTAFAATIEAIDDRLPSCRVEALVPDFQGSRGCVERVVDTALYVFAHNIETVPRLYDRVRPGAGYVRSLEVLSSAKELSLQPSVAAHRKGSLLTKSGLMLGLGETRDELLEVFADLREHGVDILTLGQYLQPTARQLDVFRYVTPAEFADMKTEAESLGFLQVVSGPLVRSSYHAWETADAVANGTGPG